MGLKRVLSDPLTEDEANSLTKDEKAWLRSWNRGAEIPDEGADASDAEDPQAGSVVPEYDDFTTEELKDKLRERDLPVSGNKQELIERLQEDDAS